MRSAYEKLMLQYPPRPIRTEAEHRRALRQLEELMAPHPSAAASMLIEVLATLVEQYESRENPTPELTGCAMLAHCLASRDVTPSKLAKETDIPLATISNVLAGRRGISKLNAFRLGEYFQLPASAFLIAEARPTTPSATSPTRKRLKRTLASATRKSKRPITT